VVLNTPAYTPQLAPAETIVPLIREAVANQSFNNLDTLEVCLAQRCAYLLQHPQIIQANANFNWLPQ